jgi:hypothetical protein
MHATLKLSMLEPLYTRLESSPYAAHLEQPDDDDLAALSTFGQNTATVALSSMTPPSTTLPISFYWCALDFSLTMTLLSSRMILKVFLSGTA